MLGKGSGQINESVLPKAFAHQQLTKHFFHCLQAGTVGHQIQDCMLRLHWHHDLDENPTKEGQDDQTKVLLLHSKQRFGFPQPHVANSLHR